MTSELPPDREDKDRQERILDATLALLARHGIAGVSMRAVAREAGVALGLLNYHYVDKTGLVRAALLRIAEQDADLVRPDPSVDPVVRLRGALRRALAPEFLAPDYLALRLQLWSLAQVHPDFAQINVDGQRRYRDGLAELIRAAAPGLPRRECTRRAADIDVIQNGVWLTALLGLDRPSLKRAHARCERIALEG